MNKRLFMKSIFATGVTALWSRGFSWTSEQKLTNWAGNIEYRTQRLYAATSLADVQRFVKTSPRFRVLGTRHCFNELADTDKEFLSLRSLDKVIQLDRKAQTVTVEAGMSYGQLCPYLDQHGFALHNLASLPHISIAGGGSTATHGSGVKNGNLATQISALEIVTASGDVLKLTRDKDGDTFRGAVVGLGALGVITKVTLDLHPAFTVKQYVYENLPFDQLQQHFDAIEASAYSVSLFTDWQNHRINEVWLKVRTDAEPRFEAKPEFFDARLATKNLHPIAELSAENCTEQMGVPGPWYERLPHFRMGFTPSAGKELQSEYFVPRSHAVEAILAIERLRDKVTPHLLISEIRTIAPDDLWLSTAYKQESVAIHFTWKQDWTAVSRLLPDIERELAPFNPRPHWGKLFTMSPAQLRLRYERLPDFVALARKLDPYGKFRNKFLEQTIFAQRSS